MYNLTLPLVLIVAQLSDQFKQNRKFLKQQFILHCIRSSAHPTVSIGGPNMESRISLSHLPVEKSFEGENAPLTNLLFLVSYDGTDFNGWNGPPLEGSEKSCSDLISDTTLDSINFTTLNNSNCSTRGRQNNLYSVSNCLLKPLLLLHGFDPSEKIAGKPNADRHIASEEKNSNEEVNFSLTGASRTDKGVHALEMACQYRSFTKTPPLNGDLLKIHSKVNRMIPPSVRVNSVLHINDTRFRVRSDNIGKIYTYRFSLNTVSPFKRLFYWQLNSDVTLIRRCAGVKKFDLERAKKTLNCYLGTHNFSAFKNVYRGNEQDRIVDPICTIENVDLVATDDCGCYAIIIKGNRFLYKMVRYMVSHVIYTALGILPEGYIGQLLHGEPGSLHVPPAPGYGLELTKVLFPEDIEKVIQESKAMFAQNINKIID